MLRPFAWAVLALALCAVLCPIGAARAEGFQASSRLGLGFGQRFERGEDRLVFAPSLRTDVLKSTRRFEDLRWGPVAELRTSDFSTVEGGAGLGLSLALGEDAALGSSTLLGGAFRDDRSSTATAAQLISVGFRDRDQYARYAVGLDLFLSVRAALSSEPLLEFTGGIEVDLLLLAAPFLGLRD